MGIVPTAFSGVTETQAQQKAFQSIARLPLVAHCGGAGANQVANGFVFLIGWAILGLIVIWHD